VPTTSEFISLTLGGVALSGFVSRDDLARIDSGRDCLVVVHDVAAGEQPLGRLVGLFSGGELASHAPVWRELPQPQSGNTN
jgi:hypothetical protein